MIPNLYRQSGPAGSFENSDPVPDINDPGPQCCFYGIAPNTLLKMFCKVFCNPFDTFTPHAIFEALFEAAMLALVPVVLVNGTVFASTALVGQVAPD
jgi:hypothetical protein